MRTVIAFVATAALVAAATAPVLGQKTAVSEIARQMTGTWTINWNLTTSVGGHGLGKPEAAPSPSALLQRGTTSYPPGVRANPTNTEPTSSKASDLTPAELAERMAMRQIVQIQPTLTITATGDHITIEDERGEQSCAINGKTDKVRTFGVYMEVKCKWDKNQLHQEYAMTRAKLIRVWSLDGKGHLVLKAKVEGVDQNSPEATTVYDRS
jgi:hypothetical protein